MKTITINIVMSQHPEIYFKKKISSSLIFALHQTIAQDCSSNINKI